MPDRQPPLDRAALRGLLEIVDDLGAGPRAGVPMADLVDLPASLPAGVGVPVDFALARELGREFIVLRVPTPPEPPPDPRLATLTPREAEIAALIAAGLANKQVAARLGLTLATVKSHVHHILAKTGLPNRAAVAVAVAGPHGSRPAVPRIAAGRPAGHQT